jgi:hypothetical protein
MIGRISMEPYAGKARVPSRKVPHPIPRTDFMARRDAESYAIALDPSGKLTDAREGKGPARHLKLVSFEKRTGDLLWLRYKLKR